MEWKKIGIEGLELYEISSGGSVRTKKNKKFLAISKEDGERCIMLTLYNDRHKFIIKDLMRYTFKPDNKEDLLKVKGKPEHFSDNEWDYGKRSNRKWEALKKEYSKLRWLKGEGLRRGNLE